jgi:hypothetical protein
MNPYQFLHHTPGSNCGDCGWPTCLAFAAAVTKAGVRADRCPHLKSEGLPPELLRGANAEKDALEHGEEERNTALATHLRSKMQGLDFSDLAPRLGVNWYAEEPDFLSFSFLNRPVRLGEAGVFVDEGQPADPRDQILLYNYVAIGCAGQARKPNNTWLGMESLPNSISKIRTLATYCEERLAERFSTRLPQFATCCTQIGGQPATKQSADAAFKVSVLPCVPLLILFWEAEPDDGFAAKVKVLFDQHVLDFLDLESLVFAAERTADRLLELDC